MVQKIIKVGNSLGLIIPNEIIKQLQVKPGSSWEIEAFAESSLITIQPIDAPAKTKITPEFKSWIDEFTKKNASLLKKLARTP